VGQKSVISIHISARTGIVPEIEQIEKAEINQDTSSCLSFSLKQPAELKLSEIS
jgi:hypothetical protein